MALPSRLKTLQATPSGGARLGRELSGLVGRGALTGLRLAKKKSKGAF